MSNKLSPKITPPSSSPLNNSQRRSLAILIISVLGFMYIEKILIPYISPESQEVKKEISQESVKKEVVSSINDISKEDTQAVNQTSSAKETNIEKITAEGFLEFDNGLTKVKISKVGGRVLSLELNKFEKDGNPGSTYNTVFSDPSIKLPGGITWKEGDDSEIIYTVTEQTPLQVKLTGRLLDGGTIEKIYNFFQDSYLFKVSASINKEGFNQPLSFEWTKKVFDYESSLLDPYNVKGFVWFDGVDSKRLPFSDMTGEKESLNVISPVWIGVGDKYFATAILNDGSINKGGVGSKVEMIQSKSKISSSKMVFSSQNNNEISVQVFSGPKSYSILEDIGFELRRLLDLGKTGIISAPLLSLLNVFYKLVNNYGLAIVLLTILVKLVLYPLNSSQFKQMKALSALKPEMDRIKETITDKQKQQMAMMDLYKNKGVNPLGGCLPVLVQMPIFIGLYSALMLSVELRHAEFGMWVHDLSSADRLMVGGFGIPMLVVLFTASMMVQQWLTPSTMDPAQKKVMMFMPLVMFFMFVNFPAGLALYWLTNNLIGIGQQQSLMYSEKSGKSGFKITAIVACAVYGLAYLCTKF